MTEQEETINEMSKIFEIFKASDGEIRPHYVLTGPSGCGKSYAIEGLALKHELKVVEINAAQLTKEGTSGNSLSKALSPLKQQNKLTIVFVDEFDKLFISGNSNSSLAHETTNGVQNEFLKLLESKKASIYDDYGKYIEVPVKNTLFIFAGAFNGEEDITIDRLRDFGIKTEFIGRVGLIYNLVKPSLPSLFYILESSPILAMYLELYPKVASEDVIATIKKCLTDTHENNTLGVRLINTLICQYFLKGGKIGITEVKKIAFQRKLEL